MRFLLAVFAFLQGAMANEPHTSNTPEIPLRPQSDSDVITSTSEEVVELQAAVDELQGAARSVGEWEPVEVP